MAFGAAVLAVIAYAASRPAATEIEPGAPAPTFELPLLTGGGAISSEDLEGKVVVVNFWWSGCYSCKEEAPALEAAWREYRDDGVVVLGVDRRGDSIAAARRFADDFQLSYPLVRDVDGVLVDAFEVGDAFPQTFYIDREGRIAAIHSGVVLEDPASGDVVVLGPVSRKSLFSQIETLIRS